MFGGKARDLCPVCPAPHLEHNEWLEELVLGKGEMAPGVWRITHLFWGLCGVSHSHRVAHLPAPLGTRGGWGDCQYDVHNP